ncbi:Conserved_hypothetical protein [Hexamita inflata]|uniref:Uncharacterized protein n=1 Tax=Hexamita inflata TaxID=28002 RepID=A0AA86NIS8_9EUKA|nr:Conserved hypothetical protein [Hexamita inflata]
MVLLQLTEQEIKLFEEAFKTVVQRRTIQFPRIFFETTKDAFNIYKNFSEFQIVNFWKDIADLCTLDRQRAYKFFRFTYSRQFYTDLNQFKQQIEHSVFDILNDYPEKDSTTHLRIWKRIWQDYYSFGLHYDATDQYVRNCVNKYYKKKKTDEIQTVQQQQQEQSV